MFALIPFGGNTAASAPEVGAILPDPREISTLPDGQSQMITIFCDPENQPALTETFLLWFNGDEEDDEWDHVIYRGHGISEKMGLAFITLEWEGCTIDALFLRQLRKEEAVLDFVTYIRDSGV